LGGEKNITVRQLPGERKKKGEETREARKRKDHLRLTGPIFRGGGQLRKEKDRGRGVHTAFGK